ncbi:MAG: L-seryl-tRNA(Sec) selenium transferase, partial [Acidobacteriota bacterium]
MGDAMTLLRHLPAVETVLRESALETLFSRFGRVMVRDTTRRCLEDLRGEILGGELDEESLAGQVAALPERIRLCLENAARQPYRRVINASGILVHTNLGRAPISRSAAEAIARAARHTVALEYDLESGQRGSRLSPLETLLEELFPGSGLAVTNNAAAVLLALNTLARGREVIISRGELVEIGGSFRVPDIMERSGARLVEVGTTNRTRVGDYRRALTAETAAVLRVHPSNFRQLGFTESATARELADLAGEAGLPLIVDQGSGNVHELGPYGIHDEPTVNSVLEEGAHLVTFSGDKLLGGPQAGLVVGDPGLVAKLKANPLARALRPDKLILAGLIETLRSHQRGKAFQEIPVLRHLAAPMADLWSRAEVVVTRLAQADPQVPELRIKEGISRMGGGSSPHGEIPTVLVYLGPVEGGEEALAQRLRHMEPAVVGRRMNGCLVLDLRSVDPEEDELLADALKRALRSLLRTPAQGGALEKEGSD